MTFADLAQTNQVRSLHSHDSLRHSLTHSHPLPSSPTRSAIQRLHKVRVELPPASSPSTAVTIRGEEGAIAAALDAMQEKLGFPPSPVPLRVARLAVPRRDHNQLIGRGGSVIRQLESRFQCNMHVPRRHERNADVVVEGPPDKVAELVAEISTLLRYEVKVSGGSGGSGGGDAAEAKEPEAVKPDYSRPINESLFFPDNDADDGYNFDRFLAYLRSATESLDVCVFTISDNQIRDVIRDLHAKGVRVRLLTDNDTMENKGNDVHQLARAGVPTKCDVSEHHMHHKFAVLDSKLLINGSFNWTYTASRKNCENIMITTHKAFVEDFKAQFEEMWANDKEFEAVQD